MTSLRLAGRLKGACFLLVTALLFSFSAATPAAARYAALVMDADTGEILHSANPDAKKYPASLTKMMTLYMVFEALEKGGLKLNQPLPVSRHAAGQSPSKLGLRPGDTVSVQDAILGLVTRSANDAAAVVAEALGGSEPQFAVMMTERARELGMKSTTFKNASGLPNTAQQTTARDMAILGRALIKRQAKYYHYFSTRDFTYEGHVINTHNRLMLNYPGADGIKTGYIGASGFNLVASAKQNGRRIIGVVFGGSSARARDDHMAQLLDKGFANLERGVRIAEAPAAEVPDVFAPPPRKHDKVAPKVAQERKAFADSKKKQPSPVKVAAQGDTEEKVWSIQVGAYSHRAKAQSAASKASEMLGPVGKSSKIAIVSSKSGKNMIYRARLVGFSEPQARAACRTIEKKNKQDCHVLDPA